MKSPIVFCGAVFCCIITGCSSMKLQTGERVFESNLARNNGRAARDAAVNGALNDPQFSGLKAMQQQLAGSKQGRAAGGQILPPSLANSPLIEKFVKANVQAVKLSVDPGRSAKGASDEGSADVKFKPGDFRHFIKDVIPAVGIDSWAVDRTAGRGRSAAKADANRQSPGFKRIEQYLAAYFAGKFVDRSGSLLAKPAIKDNKIGNDSIVGFVSVIFEALYDSAYATPVFYKTDNAQNKVWLNAGGKEPFFAALTKDQNGNYDGNLVAEVKAGSAITEDEVHAIQFLSSVASDQSKLLSGFVLRFFNDVELSYVIGGDFAIGDNDTLAKVVDAFFEIGSDRTTEAVSFHYFKGHSAADYGPGLNDLIATLQTVYKAVQ